MFLSNQEQSNLGKYIRACEVDRMQSAHYESEYDRCALELGSRYSVSEKVLGSLLLLLIGYSIGANH
jgi:hypothetical protein